MPQSRGSSKRKTRPNRASRLVLESLRAKGNSERVIAQKVGLRAWAREFDWKMAQANDVDGEETDADSAGRCLVGDGGRL